jgi:hypothetical protein
MRPTTLSRRIFSANPLTLAIEIPSSSAPYFLLATIWDARLYLPVRPLFAVWRVVVSTQWTSFFIRPNDNRPDLEEQSDGALITERTSLTASILLFP